MFTTSPDEHRIADRHPAMDGVFIAARFGHGQKLSNVTGRMMADFCLGGVGLPGRQVLTRHYRLGVRVAIPGARRPFQKLSAAAIVQRVAEQKPKQGRSLRNVT